MLSLVAIGIPGPYEMNLRGRYNIKHLNTSVSLVEATASIVVDQV